MASNAGTITNSYSIGSVRGRNDVGGLVGFNDGTISSSYSNNTVDGDGNVGGLVGVNDGSVINSYSDEMVISLGDGFGAGLAEIVVTDQQGGQVAQVGAGYQRLEVVVGDHRLVQGEALDLLELGIGEQVS